MALAISRVARERMRTIFAVVGSLEEVVEDWRVGWIQIESLSAVQRDGYQARGGVALIFKILRAGKG
jgi:hypothetical protein